jgi:hypothetical protein
MHRCVSCVQLLVNKNVGFVDSEGGGGGGVKMGRTKRMCSPLPGRVSKLNSRNNPRQHYKQEQRVVCVCVCVRALYFVDVTVESSSIDTKPQAARETAHTVYTVGSMEKEREDECVCMC